jgi:hypothetical protein
MTIGPACDVQGVNVRVWDICLTIQKPTISSHPRSVDDPVDHPRYVPCIQQVTRMKSSQAIINAYISLYLDVKGQHMREKECGIVRQHRFDAFVSGLQTFLFPEQQHKAVYEALCIDLCKIKLVLQRFTALFSGGDTLLVLNQIHSPEWRDLVQAAFYRYLITDSDASTSDLLIQALRKSWSAQHWDGLVTLALAVWKARCLLQMPKDSDYKMLLQWKTSGWKGCKMDQQESSAIFIVVNSVKPFLRPTPLSHYRDTTDNESGAESICLNSPPRVLETFLTNWLKFSEDEPDPYKKTGLGDYTCLLCLERMDRHHLEHHSMDSKHLTQLPTFKSCLTCLRNVIMTCGKLYTEPLQNQLGMVDQIAYPPWRDATHAKLYRLLFDPLTRYHEDKSLNTHLNLKEQLMELQKSVDWESLAILGLVSWRALCLGQMPIGSDYLAAEHWKSVGWKSSKAEHENFSNMQVIVEAVKPFLALPYQNDPLLGQWGQWMSMVPVHVVGYIVYVWIHFQKMFSSW